MLNKKIILFFCSFVFFFISITPTFAQVVINEFSVKPDDKQDWIELYSQSTTDISGWYLKDETSVFYTFSNGFSISENSFSVTSKYQRLDDFGDSIYLYDAANNIKDSISYGGEGEVCIPSSSESIGRLPFDGGNTIDRISNPSNNSSNNYSILNPCPTPLLTPTPTPNPTPTATQTPTPTPTPTTKGYYKINEVKDSSGSKLDQVKIYVDSVYIHHYTPETLTFCDGCKCDEVACGFGSHIFKLEKSGYNEWTETKAIYSGDNHEATPILSLVSISNTITVAPTQTSIPAKPKPSLTAKTQVTRNQDEPLSVTEGSEELILGYQNKNEENQEDDTQPDELVTGNISNKFPFTAFLLIIGGVLLVSGSMISFIKIKKGEKHINKANNY